MGTLDLYEIELKDEFGKIKDIGIESDEHRKVVGDISQLTDRLVKLKEVENERQKIEIEREKMTIEQQKIGIEESRLDDERKDRVIKNIIAGLGVAIPAGITLTGMVLMFIFEERGTITSKAGGKIVDRIFRMK